MALTISEMFTAEIICTILIAVATLASCVVPGDTERHLRYE